MNSKIRDCEQYLDLFPKSIDDNMVSPDSNLFQGDTLSISTDSIMVKANTDTLQSELLKEKVDLAP